MRIRIRSKELTNMPLSLKKNIVEEYYFRMMSKQHQGSQNTEEKLFSFLHDLNDEQLFYLINTEPPKVIALAIDQLNKKIISTVQDKTGASIRS